MEAKETIWKKCLEKIEGKILPDNYATWFSPTYPRDLEDGLITITVPNQFYRKCLIENYRELIENTLNAVANDLRDDNSINEWEATWDDLKSAVRNGEAEIINDGYAVIR